MLPLGRLPSGYMMLRNLNIVPGYFDDVFQPERTMGIGVFLTLRPSIRRYRLVIRCRKAVYLARFLQCRDVMHARLCSRGLRASVSPSAVDYDWCRPLLLKGA